MFAVNPSLIEDFYVMQNDVSRDKNVSNQVVTGICMASHVPVCFRLIIWRIAFWYYSIDNQSNIYVSFSLMSSTSFFSTFRVFMLTVLVPDTWYIFHFQGIIPYQSINIYNCFNIWFILQYKQFLKLNNILCI